MKLIRSVVGSLAVAVSSVFLLSACQSVEVTQNGAVLTADASNQAEIIWIVYNDEFVTEGGPAKALTTAFLQDWSSSDPTYLAFDHGEFDCYADTRIPARSPVEIEICTEYTAVESALVGLFEAGKIAGAESVGNELDLDVTNFQNVGDAEELPEGWNGCGYYIKAVVLNENDSYPSDLRSSLEIMNAFLDFFGPNTPTTDFICQDELGAAASLAKTGAEVERLALGSLIAVVAGAGLFAIGRRKRTQ